MAITRPADGKIVVTAGLLAAMVAGSGAKKLQRDQQVLDVIGGTVGVPDRPFPSLAALELAGAAASAELPTRGATEVPGFARCA